MGKFISGGFVESSTAQDKQPMQSQNSQRQEQPIQPQQMQQQAQPMQQQQLSGDEEGYAEYIMRNLAKSPALAYQMARSGLGVGNILDLLSRKVAPEGGMLSQLGTMLPSGTVGSLSPEARKRLIESSGGTYTPQEPPSLLRALLPTSEQAREEISQVLPSYMTERRPGDEPAEFLLSELPFIAAQMASGVGLPTAIARSTGIVGGGYLGGEMGAEVGEALGDREIGQTLGGLGGGIAGGALAHALTQRPSKQIAPRIEEAEKAAFEGGREQRLAEAEREYKPQIAEQEETARRAMRDLAKEKKTFQKEKLGAVEKRREAIKKYEEKITNLDQERNKNYLEASKREVGQKAAPKEIISTLKEVKKDLGAGHTPADRRAIENNIKALSQRVKGGKPLSLSDAKKFQKNFNDQIYNRDASRSFKREMNKITSSLNDFISKVGSDEHDMHWRKAEEATRELKALQRGKKDFVKSKTQEIADIRREKFSPEKEVFAKQAQETAKKALSAAEKEYGSKLKDIKKETFEKFLASKEDQNQTAQLLTRIMRNPIIDTFGMGALGSVVSSLFGTSKVLGVLGGKLLQAGHQEYSAIRNALKSHPEYVSDYAKVLMNVGKMSIPQAVKNLSEITSELKKETGSPKSKTGKGFISGGLKK